MINYLIVKRIEIPNYAKASGDLHLIFKNYTCTYMDVYTALHVYNNDEVNAFWQI